MDDDDDDLIAPAGSRRLDPQPEPADLPERLDAEASAAPAGGSDPERERVAAAAGAGEEGAEVVDPSEGQGAEEAVDAGPSAASRGLGSMTGLAEDAAPPGADPFAADPFAEDALADAPDVAPVALEEDPFADAAEPEPEGEAAPEPKAASGPARPKVRVNVGAVRALAGRVELPPPAPRAPEGERSSVGDSTGEGAEPPAPPPARRGAAFAVGGLCVVALLGVGALGLRAIEREHVAEERAAFLGEAGDLPLEEALARVARLSADARADDEVARLVVTLEERQRRRQARERAEAALRAARGQPDPAERLRALDAAVVADPTYAAGYVERARLRYRLAQEEPAGGSPHERAREALADLNAAVRSAPGEAAGHYWRARLYAELGEEQAALSDLEQAIALGDGALLAAARGLRAELAGDADEALLRYEDALRLDPEWPGAHLARARAHLSRDEARAALREAEWARKQDATAAGPDLAIAEALRRLGEDPRRLGEALQRALQRQPLHPRALALAADLLLERGPGGRITSDEAARQAAAEQAERALALAPAEPLASLVLGELAAHRGQLSRAQHLLLQAAAGDRRVRAAALGHRARIHVAQGRSDEAARRDLDQSIGLSADQAFPFSLRGRLRLAAGDVEGARRDLDRALHLAPTLTEALYDRARVALRETPPDLAQALADLDAFLERRPGVSGDVYFLRGTARWRAYRWEGALADFTQAEQRGGGFPRDEAARLRGDCHFARQDWSAAAEAYQQFLQQADPDDDWREHAEERLATCRQHLSGHRRIL